MHALFELLVPLRIDQDEKREGETLNSDLNRRKKFGFFFVEKPREHFVKTLYVSCQCGCSYTSQHYFFFISQRAILPKSVFYSSLCIFRDWLCTQFRFVDGRTICMNKSAILKYLSYKWFI